MLADRLRLAARRGIPTDNFIEYGYEEPGSQLVVRNRRGINGTRFATTVYDAGRIGVGTFLQGNGINTGYKTPAGAVSYSTWVRLANVTGRHILLGDWDAAVSTASGRFHFGIYGSSFEYVVGNGVTYDNVYTGMPHGIAAGALTHLGVSVDGNKVEIWKNGVLMFERTATVSKGGLSPSNLILGSAGLYTLDRLYGALDLTRVYPRKLGAAEWAALAAEGPKKDSRWNPAQLGSATTLTQENRMMRTPGSNSGRAMVSASSGKRMFEAVIFDTNVALVGVGTSGASLAAFPGFDANGWAYYLYSGAKYHNSGSGAAYAAASSIGDVIGVAVDFTAGTLAFHRNGAPLGVAFTNLAGKTLFPMGGSGGGGYFPQFLLHTGEEGFIYPIAGYDVWA